MDRDPAYLLDMLLAARDVQALSAGMTWEAFEQSKLHQYALVKAIEIIGEAARSISEDTKTAHPEIPWIAIIDMRNHLLHRYFRIDLKLVWEVVQKHVAPLIEQLEPLIPKKDPGEEPAASNKVNVDTP